MTSDSSSLRIDRGQTQIDFAVGAGVFLLALAFVVAFVPTLFEPFSTASTSSPIVADRAAAGIIDLLSTSATGSPAFHTPTNHGVFSPACTVAFFAPNETLANDADCPFNASISPEELLEIEGDVQVVVHGLNESAPVDVPEGIDIETRHGTFDGVETSRASADPSTARDAVTVSRRVVSLNGEQYRLTVRVW